MSLFSTFKTEVESLGDMKELTQVGYKIITTLFLYFINLFFQIAFHNLNPFPLRAINNKRENHQKIIKVRIIVSTCYAITQSIMFSSLL